MKQLEMFEFNREKPAPWRVPVRDLIQKNSEPGVVVRGGRAKVYPSQVSIKIKFCGVALFHKNEEMESAEDKIAWSNFLFGVGRSTRDLCASRLVRMPPACLNRFGRKAGRLRQQIDDSSKWIATALNQNF